MRKYKHVRLLERTHDKLKEIAASREASENPIYKNIDILEELVTKLHKKECKK